MMITINKQELCHALQIALEEKGIKTILLCQEDVTFKYHEEHGNYVRVHVDHLEIAHHPPENPKDIPF